MCRNRRTLAYERNYSRTIYILVYTLVDLVFMNSDVTLRVPRVVAEQLEEDAKQLKEYKHSRAKWADYARDLLRKAVEVEG